APDFALSGGGLVRAGRCAVGDWVLLLGLALASGGWGAVSPIPVAVAAIASAILLLRRVGAFMLVTLLAAALAGALRARAAVASFDTDRKTAREAIGAPSRCEAEAIVVDSPTSMGGTLRWLGDLSGASCEGKVLPSPLRARLYGG